MTSYLDRIMPQRVPPSEHHDRRCVASDPACSLIDGKTQNFLPYCTQDQLKDSRGLKLVQIDGSYKFCEANHSIRTLKRGSNDRQAKTNDGGGDLFGIIPTSSPYVFRIVCKNRNRDLCGYWRGDTGVEFGDLEENSRWLFRDIGKDNFGRQQYELFTYCGSFYTDQVSIRRVGIDSGLKYSGDEVKYQLKLVLLKA